MRNLTATFVMAATASTCLAGEPTAPSVSIIPRPVHLEIRQGEFEITHATALAIVAPTAENLPAADFLVEVLKSSLGTTMQPSYRAGGRLPASGIVFHMDPGLPALGREGYRLDITTKRILVTAAASAGHFYAVQTLLQLMPPSVFVPRKEKGQDRVPVHCVAIIDTPRFAYRGMHLDVSRHFLPKEFVKRFIDLIAMHKMNRFHWHLTDDNGWRIESKKYPELTTVSAWRVDREHQPWDARDPQRPGEQATYGGFYTQEEIREMVAYAAARNVTILPEIEMPGHSSEVFAAYPELSCRGERLTVRPGGYWPNVDIFCAGNDSVFAFLQNVLEEVMSLFPCEYIHIGGDEADKTLWKTCRKCQARVRAEGLHNESELQSYFIRRIERFVLSRGKRIIGWDEILEGGLAPEATVMSWRGIEGGIAAARQGHAAIMTPTSYCYFDYYQGDPATEPEAIGGYTTLKRVYGFEPVPSELTPAEANMIVGAQGNVWTEYIPTPEKAEYMSLPRMTALAEVVWSPRGPRDWNDFRGRLEEQFRRFDAMGVSYSRGSYQVAAETRFNSVDSRLEVSLTSEQWNPAIHYTLDGSDPTPASSRYTVPLVMPTSSTVKAVIVLQGIPQGKSTEQEVVVHGANGSAVSYRYPFSGRYPSTAEALVDGLRGSLAYGDGHWQGFLGNDADVIVTLPQEKSLRWLSVTFLKDVGSYVLLPEEVRVSVSLDGVTFNDMPVPAASLVRKAEDAAIYEYRCEIAGQRPVRQIRVHAVNPRVMPPGSRGEGESAWIFADEIVVN